MDWTTATAVISGTIAVIAVWLSLKRPKLNLPPLIPGLPLLGNTLQMLNLTHVRLDEWKNEYGPIYSLNTWGGVVVVVSNAATASDILDKMSAVTSSRRDLILATELMTKSNIFIIQKYGDRWRKHRRGAHESIRSAERFYPVQEHEARILVRDLSVGVSECGLDMNLRRTAASTIWRETYGGPPLKSDDRALIEINNFADHFLAAVDLGGSIVDLIPLLNYLPFSLAPFKQYAEKFFTHSNAFFMGLANVAINRKVVYDDSSKLNFCASLDEHKAAMGLSDQEVAWISGTMFLAGSETTSAALHYFVLCMVLHPHVSRKAHEELDIEVGDRPPTFGDRDRLPYIEAIVKEVLRWRPGVPLGGLHVVTEDFPYKGYIIPKGATIVSNIWSITHDPALFDNPDVFMPERFLEDSMLREPNVRYDDLGFGYGRRICPGRDVAINSLFIDIATMLWAFEFHKAVDSEGREITPPSMEFRKAGGTVRPKPFPFKLVPRPAAVGRVVDGLRDL